MQNDNSGLNTKSSGFLTLPLVRDIAIVLLLVVISWKLFSSEMQIDLSKFSFSELLALLLSLFSVWLSVAFYFKAGDTSNQFYDNSYKFTKEMSEILGRIEAGFGERLRHLDEGYSGIRDRFDRLPHYGQSINAEVKKEEAEIAEREKEQQELLEILATRAQLAEGEKQEIFAKLAAKAEELEEARLELRRLRRSKADLTPHDREVRNALVQYVAGELRKAPSTGVDITSPKNSVSNIFRKIRPNLVDDAIRDLRRFNLTDENGDLTRDAAMLLRDEIKRQF